jgi:hypothetical protein
MSALARMAKLIARLERSDARDPDAAEAAVFERLLAVSSELDESEVESLRAGVPRLPALYGRYVQGEETREARALLARSADAECLERGEGGDFAGRSYARVADLFERVDFTGCRVFVMVGCGPLPVTLLHVAAKTRVPRLVGLEVDERSARCAREICERLRPSRIDIRLVDGSDYDYARADVVYLANLVRRKACVLARIAEQVGPDTQVIVREPFGAGALFAERGLVRHDPRLEWLAAGPENPRFLSHHVFLQRTHEPARPGRWRAIPPMGPRPRPTQRG